MRSKQSNMAAYPSFTSFCKDIKKANDNAAVILILIASILRCSQRGMFETEEAPKVIGRAYKALACEAKALGLKNPENLIPVGEWQHRGPDAGKDEWLEVTSRMITHAEVLATLAGNSFSGRVTAVAGSNALLARLDNIRADLRTLASVLKLSPRQCAESL